MKLTKAVFSLFMACAFFVTAEEKDSKIGIVNFTQCVTESRLGKAEQESLENVKNQMSNLIKDIEQQLTDISAKFNDADYLDGLSPEGEQELKAKYHSLKEEYDRYQAQFYQVMQQANMRLLQTVSGSVNLATQKIAKEDELSLVINKDACFSFDNSFDITQKVISEMDVSYDELVKQQAQSVSEKQENEAKDQKAS